MSLMEKTGTPVGNYAPDFELPGIDKQVHHLSRYLETFRAVGVIFICNHCSYVRSYIERLRQLQSEFRFQDCTLIGINANDAQQEPKEGFEEMKLFAQQVSLNFPYLWDPTQDVARSFGAGKTPEAFLIDQAGTLCYSGQIDDNPMHPEAVEVPYFRNAIAALLNNQEIKPTSTEAIGCPIQWRR